MHIEVAENKVIQVLTLEGTTTSSINLLPQKEKMEIEGEVYEKLEAFVSEVTKGDPENNPISNEQIEAKSKEYYAEIFEKRGNKDIYVILINNAPAYQFENIEEGQGILESLKEYLKKDSSCYVVYHEGSNVPPSVLMV